MPNALRVDLARCEQQVCGMGMADDARQHPGDAVLGDQAALREGCGKDGLVRGNSEIAVESHHQTEPGGGAVDRANDGLEGCGKGPRFMSNGRVHSSARMSSGGSTSNPSMPMAAQKARPGPVKTSARTALSRQACSMALGSSDSRILVSDQGQPNWRKTKFIE
jgi:hypothetical protein